ncbi:MAG: isochorismatase family protein [bacterium]|nr:isochorismatase family protein [bacterium]
MMLDAERAMLLVIDVQTKLLPYVCEAEDMLTATAELLRGTRVFKLPMLATTQYVKGLGPTHPAIDRVLTEFGVETIEKASFSACDEAVRARLREIDRPQVLVVGIEAHVCVQQSVLDLLAMEYQVFVCADAVSSRRSLDRDTAIARMRACGATVTTVESALFELCGLSGTDAFKQLLDVVKAPERISL